VNKVIGLIPARKGSSLANKNIRSVGGKSLLERAVLSARECSLLSEVWVSSDSEEYLEHALELGAMPHLRSAEASSSRAPAEAVLVDFFKDRDPSSVVYLQPTSPLRTGKHVSGALAIFLEDTNFGVMSVSRLIQFPNKILSMNPSSGLLEASNDAFSNRKAVSDFLYPNGAIYILPGFKKPPSFTAQKYRPFLMTRVESIDLDTDEDFELVERVYRGSSH